MKIAFKSETKNLHTKDWTSNTKYSLNPEARSLALTSSSEFEAKRSNSEQKIRTDSTPAARISALKYVQIKRRQ